MSDDNKNGGGGAADLAAAIAGLVSRHNNEPLKAVETLLSENFGYREKLREVQTRMDELQKKLPGEDALILAGEEKKLFEGYRQLKLKPEELAAALQEREQLAAARAQLEREKDLKEVATAYGWEPAVLVSLAETLEIEVQSIEHEGKPLLKAEVVMLTEDGKRQTTMPLEKYAETHWKAFMPALKPAAKGSDETGAPFIRQPTGGAPAAGDKDDPITRHLRAKEEARKAAPNALTRTLVPPATGGAKVR